jgi:hypothetical protein
MPQAFETFYGPWSIEVVQRMAAFSQRFRIQGSDTSDGIYSGTPGLVLPLVRGTRWTLTMEWNDDIGSAWQASEIRKRATYTVDAGLIITLGADDNLSHRRDHDFDDLVLICRSLDPAVDPIPLGTTPLSFELPHCKHRGDERDEPREPDGHQQDDRRQHDYHRDGGSK